jgi:hypothetical protein
MRGGVAGARNGPMRNSVTKALSFLPDHDAEAHGL